MSLTFRPCILIPCYNHGAMMANVLTRLTPFQLPIIVVDDGSDASTRQTLDQLATDNAHVTLVRLTHNAGKGAAVIRGLKVCAGGGIYPCGAGGCRRSTRD